MTSGDAPLCTVCGKALLYGTAQGRCLTCEYRSRHVQTMMLSAGALAPRPGDGAPEEAPREAFDATIGLADRAPLPTPVVFDDSATQASAPPPGVTAGRRSFGAGGRTASRTLNGTLPSLPYAPSEVLGTVGDYDLLSELGVGGMGVVYRAFSRRLGRYVALKVIRAGGSASDQDVARFINEAMLAGRLSHPNIVRVYDAQEAPTGESYFVMELIEGGTLGDRMRRGLRADDAAPDGRITLRDVALVLEKTARAVQHAHDKGIIHRDIKPDNILVDGAGEPHVTDFGIAKGVTGDDRTDLTVAGHIMGSPHYMSPEQANGEVATIGVRSDVYALGATLYHALAGRPMFEGTTPMSIVLQVISSEPVRPSLAAATSGAQRVPLDLETICLKATEKEAARRYATAGELADELKRWLEGEPILARPVGRLERLQKRLRKNKRLLVGSFIGATIVLVLGAAFTLSLFDNVRRSARSLAELDRTEALGQAAIVERAIRVNMLQGRADLARQLVHRLAADKTAGRIHVLRTDGSPAYTDRTTRRHVERRITNAAVLAEVGKKHPELLEIIDELKRRGFPSIDKSAPPPELPAQVSLRHFKKALEQRQPVTYIEETRARHRRLVVLKPIENSERCQTCHGGINTGYDGEDNRVRAVLVVRRPLDHVEEVIASNRRATLAIGSGTAGVLLVLIFLFARVFGIGLGRRKFG